MRWNAWALHRHIRRRRANKRDSQGARRSPTRHLGTHRFIHQRSHQATKTGATLPPLRRDRHGLRIVTHSLKQFRKTHNHLTHPRCR